jgi:hypothetical protein
MVKFVATNGVDFIASNGVPVAFDRQYLLRDGEMVRYFSAKGWSFSSLPDEDADIKYAREAVQAWQAWVEFLESGGLNDSGD